MTIKPNYIVIPAIVIAVMLIGSSFTSEGMDWYRAMVKLPAFTPPGFVIGTVWTILFALTAASILIFWNKAERDEHFWWIISTFAANGALNVLWSYLFFSRHLLRTATFEAGLLGLSVVQLIWLIWPYSKKAASLLIPYAAWVSFATYLTYTIWQLNPAFGK